MFIVFTVPRASLLPLFSRTKGNEQLHILQTEPSLSTAYWKGGAETRKTLENTSQRATVHAADITSTPKQSRIKHFKRKSRRMATIIGKLNKIEVLNVFANDKKIYIFGGGVNNPF